MTKMNFKQPNATLAALCLTELLSWATLYYIFSIFVAPMQAELGWTQPELMGALSALVSFWAATVLSVRRNAGAD